MKTLLVKKHYGEISFMLHKGKMKYSKILTIRFKIEWQGSNEIGNFSFAWKKVNFLPWKQFLIITSFTVDSFIIFPVWFRLLNIYFYSDFFLYSLNKAKAVATRIHFKFVSLSVLPFPLLSSWTNWSIFLIKKEDNFQVIWPWSRWRFLIYLSRQIFQSFKHRKESAYRHQLKVCREVITKVPP